MGKMSDLQFEFAKDLNIFFCYMISRQIKFTIGECWRRYSTQKWLYENHWSNTLRSDHMYKLAIDIFFWIGGKYIDNSPGNVEIIQPLGKHWEMLNPANYWNGFVMIKGRPDLNHFGRHRK